MYRLVSSVVAVVCLVAATVALANERYSLRLCDNPNYYCARVNSGETWYSLFPDDQQRDLVMRINRMNTEVHGGMIIAVPKNLDSISLVDVSPFNLEIAPPGRDTVVVDPNRNAWAAYSSDGKLVRWGPASLGQDYCPDIRRGCHTVTGSFSIYSKGGEDCKSRKFPIPRGGAPMPYCMFFKGGYAMHGSAVPGYNASHGCIRLFDEDAEWMSREFASVGTSVIVLPYKKQQQNYDDPGDAD